jgi:hypothetical protein
MQKRIRKEELETVRAPAKKRIESVSENKKEASRKWRDLEKYDAIQPNRKGID